MRDRTRDVILRGMMKIHGYRAEKFSFLCFFHRCVRILLAQYRVFDMWHAQRVETVDSVLLSFFLSSQQKETSRLGSSLSLSFSLPLPSSRLPNIAKLFFARLTFDDASSRVCKKCSVRHTRKRTHICTHDGGRSVDAAVAT